MLDNLSGETRLYPIVGDPIAFVKSPKTFTRGLEARGQDAICIPMQVPAEGLESVIQALTVTANVDGLLVTMPHKATMFGYCATSDRTASLLRAVSVARRNTDGSWHGGMLDGEAFVKAQIDAGAKPKGAKVLLVGAGAAGGAIAVSLLDAGVKELVLCDQDEKRAKELKKILDSMGKGSVNIGRPAPCGYDMICNASPMGLRKDDPLPVDVAQFDASMFVGDVIAGHGTTPVLQAAMDAGCKTANGVQMVEAVQEMMLDFMLQR